MAKGRSELHSGKLYFHTLGLIYWRRQLIVPLTPIRYPLMSFSLPVCFAKNETGNFAVMGIVIMVPLVLSAGMYFDYSRVSTARTQAQHSVDAAALVATNQPGMSNSELTDHAHSFVVGNMSGDSEYELTDIGVTRGADGSVTVDMDARVQSVFMKIGDFPKLDYSVTASANILDINTGSDGCVYLTDPHNTGL